MTKEREARMPALIPIICDKDNGCSFGDPVFGIFVPWMGAAGDRDASGIIVSSVGPAVVAGGGGTESDGNEVTVVPIADVGGNGPGDVVVVRILLGRDVVIDAGVDEGTGGGPTDGVMSTTARMLGKEIIERTSAHIDELLISY
jgi:hypothetical protein